jgi:PAS domain S-box-containing protein
VVGDVPWGAHFCQFYETAGDLVDTLVPYFREGLIANEFCMWITSAPLDVIEATSALRAAVPDLDARIADGQIEILDYRDWYLRDGVFDAVAILDGWLAKLAAAREREFEGLRLSGNTFWLEDAAWDDFYRYEEMINETIGRHRMLAVCTYSLARCGAKEIVEVIDNHEFALIKRGGRWEVLESAIQKRAEQAIRESEERLTNILNNSIDAVYRRNLDTGRFEYFSPAIERISGCTVDEVATWSTEEILDRVHPDDLLRVRQEKMEMLETCTEGTVDYRLRQREGAYVWVSDRFRLIHDETGRPLYRDGVIRNVTEQKQIEEALQRSNVDLQRFAYIASHDLQEPLRSVVSFSQLLERRYKGRLDSDADEYLDFIVEGGQRMQRLIQDLLQVSRIETQARPLEPTDPAALVADVMRSLETLRREAGATLEVGDLPMVKADPAQLEQVFANLIGNAIKYRRRDIPPTIRIASRATNGMIEFSVSDNGIGIEAEYFDRIFEMFRRLHTHDAYEGTGIGLAIVKRIVERHGGTVRVESTPNEGTTISFTLPAANR